MASSTPTAPTKPWWQRRWAIVAGVILVVIVLGAVFGSSEDDETASPTAVPEATATAVPEATATAVPEAGLSISDDCLADMQAAAAVPDLQDTAEDLWPTFSSCTTLDEWKAAAIETGEAERIGIDSWVPNQCTFEPAVADTPLCASLPTPP